MLEHQLVSLLQEKKLKICALESCTAGLFMSTIVNVPSASQVFDAGFVTYSNESKIALGVSPDTIQNFGAVSEEVALEMAACAQAKTNVEIGVGISGIAGPSGGTKLKPVGTVCFGIKIKTQSFSYTQHFTSHKRNTVREESVKFLIQQIIDLLQNIE